MTRRSTWVLLSFASLIAIAVVLKVSVDGVGVFGRATAANATQPLPRSGNQTVPGNRSVENTTTTHSSGPVVNAASYGAVATGSVDDTAALQHAIDAVANRGGGTVYLPAGTYMVNATKSVVLRSNVTLQLAKDATIEALPTSQGSYSVLLISNVHNVTVTGGTIMGDRLTHIGNTPVDYGRDINIEYSTNVTISNVAVKDSWGDGIYIGDYGGHGHSSDITVNDVTCTDNRRNGMSLIDGANILVENSTFVHNRGQNPQAGLDVEPNNDTDELDNIRLVNLTTGDEGQGVQVGLTAMQQSTTPLSVQIVNCHDHGSAIGLFISTPRRNGNITVIGSSWTNNAVQSVRQLNRSAYQDDSFLPVHVSVEFKATANSAPLRITSAQLPAAQVGTLYSYQLTASGGMAPYRWALNQPLPAGITLTPNGYLKGLPQQAGQYAINVIASDGEYNVRSKLFTLHVTAAPGT